MGSVPFSLPGRGKNAFLFPLFSVYYVIFGLCFVCGCKGALFTADEGNGWSPQHHPYDPKLQPLRQNIQKEQQWIAIDAVGKGRFFLLKDPEGF